MKRQKEAAKKEKELASYLAERTTNEDFEKRESVSSKRMLSTLKSSDDKTTAIVNVLHNYEGIN